MERTMNLRRITQFINIFTAKEIDAIARVQFLQLSEFAELSRKASSEFIVR